LTDVGRAVAFTEGELDEAEGRLLAKATGAAMPPPFDNYKN
jgi:acyl-coenzyme A thioesterase PaaI-like protein